MCDWGTLSNKHMDGYGYDAGVESVAIKGEQVVVTGEGVDCTTLACALRKKLGWAEIISVEGQKAAAQSGKPAVVNPSDPPICYYLPYGPYPQVLVCECQNPSPCSIL